MVALIATSFTAGLLIILSAVFSCVLAITRDKTGVLYGTGGGSKKDLTHLIRAQGILPHACCVTWKKKFVKSIPMHFPAYCPLATTDEMYEARASILCLKQAICHLHDLLKGSEFGRQNPICPRSESQLINCSCLAYTHFESDELSG